MISAGIADRGVPAGRTEEFAANLELLRRFMGSAGLDCMVLSDHANVAWLAGGGRSFVGWATDQGAARVVVTPSQVALVTTNIEARRMAAEEFPNLPWQVIEHPWWESPAPVLARLIPRGGRVGVDGPIPWVEGTVGVGAEIARLRTLLTPQAQDRVRALGKAVGEVMAGVCRELQQGETELQIAGRMAGGLVARGIEVPVCLVAADERAFRWRHFLPTARPLRFYAMLAVCGRKDGLVVSCTRLVHFGPPPPEIVRGWEAVSRIDAGVMAATRPGATADELFDLLRESYAATGYPDEWRNHHQGGLAGYKPREWLAAPDGTERVGVGQIYAWNPSVPGAKSEDTLLVGPEGNEILTDAGDFPYREFPTAWGSVRRPEILVR